MAYTCTLYLQCEEKIYQSWPEVLKCLIKLIQLQAGPTHWVILNQSVVICGLCQRRIEEITDLSTCSEEEQNNGGEGEKERDSILDQEAEVYAKNNEYSITERVLVDYNLYYCLLSTVYFS